MIFRYLSEDTLKFKLSRSSFIIKLQSSKDIWLFNCSEGCQVNIFSQTFKINNLAKIIITSLNIDNISGLLGLLSSLNLTGRVKELHIYAPLGLKYYLDLGKKYSHTNFSYIIYLHTLKTGLLIKCNKCYLYSFVTKNSYEFVITKVQQYGKFCLDRAQKSYLLPGPLYGCLKKGSSFLQPDGFIINGSSFTTNSLEGKQFSIVTSCYCKRRIFENSIKARIVIVA
uniref:Ribonuclease Z n=1 Tax=Cliftonaea pectinata TaxID=2007206 RepID=A0A1Z1MQK6_9FLOR|nr:ribonuclease Z [Cliftonaea pectinata]ARW68055.1 ribonuclease Z [Cliftonaea pectinata]